MAGVKWLPFIRYLLPGVIDTRDGENTIAQNRNKRMADRWINCTTSQWDLTGQIKRARSPRVLFPRAGNRPRSLTERGGLMTQRPSDLDLTPAGESMAIRAGRATDVDLTACSNPFVKAAIYTRLPRNRKIRGTGWRWAVSVEEKRQKSGGVGGEGERGGAVNEREYVRWRLFATAQSTVRQQNASNSNKVTQTYYYY